MHDPLLHEIPLPHAQVFYPLGFPMQLLTNSREVLGVADRTWSAYPKLFADDPLRLRVVVGGAAASPAAQPIYRGQEHLLSIVAGPDDFAVADLAGGFGFAWVTAATVADEPRLRSAFLETPVYTMIGNRRLTAIHAACVSLGGRAVLLCGPSGAGKSTLAYTCARCGFTYLSDEVSSVVRGDAARTVIGRPLRIRFRPSAGDVLPELRGLPAGIAANGKATIEIDTAALGEIATAFTGRIEALVFLDRRAGADAALLPLPKHDARARLAAEIPVLERSTWQEQIASLDVLLEAGTFELRYSEAPQAVGALRALVCGT